MASLHHDVDISAIEPMLIELWDRGGTDLHLTPGAPPLLRIDGDLVPIQGHPPLTEEDSERYVLGLLAEEHSETYLTNRQVDFSFGWKDLTRFRGNAFYQRGAMALSLRVIPYRIPTFQELGLPPILEQFCHVRQGLILITGPTGSGKSTSQASMIDFINSNFRRHVLTLEDPMEYVHHHKLSAVNQREIGLDTRSFQEGLRAALREDPDIVLVGEMRDPESIATTLTIAETGHLVFATLHTNDTATALDRIIDVFPPGRQNQIRVQVASSLIGAVAQRLVPRIGGGLVAAFEILLANSASRNLIREGKTHQLRNIMLQHQREGMQTLEQSLSALVHHGFITYEDAVERSVVPKDVAPPPQALTPHQAYAAPAPT